MWSVSSFSQKVLVPSTLVAMRVLITGASSGLGEGLALHYARPGAIVGIVARRAPALEVLADTLRDRGARALIYPADVTDTKAMRAVAHGFADEARGVDLVIANAGVAMRGPVRESDPSAVADLFAINVAGVTNTLMPFVPIMTAQRGGVLCAVSSVAGHRGLPGRAAYSASKAAVITFVDALRMELAGTGVHAMTLCPGFVRTPMTDVLEERLPFLLERDDAVVCMVHAIEKRVGTYTFPWQMRVLHRVLEHAPEWLVRRATRKAPRST